MEGEARGVRRPGAVGPKSAARPAGDAGDAGDGCRGRRAARVPEPPTQERARVHTSRSRLPEAPGGRSVRVAERPGAFGRATLGTHTCAPRKGAAVDANTCPRS